MSRRSVTQDPDARKRLLRGAHQEVDGKAAARTVGDERELFELIEEERDAEVGLLRALGERGEERVGRLGVGTIRKRRERIEQRRARIAAGLGDGGVPTTRPAAERAVGDHRHDAGATEARFAAAAPGPDDQARRARANEASWIVAAISLVRPK